MSRTASRRGGSVVVRSTRLRSPRIAAVGILALAIAVGSAPTARSQSTNTLPDGIYAGGIYLKLNTGFAEAGDAGRIDTRGDAAGDASIVVDSDSISGSWTLEGSGTVEGVMVLGDAGSAVVAGNIAMTGSGEFSGTATDGRLTGSLQSTGQVTATTSRGTVPIPADNEDPFDEPLTDLLVSCSQLLGRWDAELQEKMEARGGPGFQITVNGIAAYFVLSDEVVITAESAIANQMRDLAKQGNLTLGQARAGGDGLVAMSEGVDILRAVEQLQADIANKESDCPTDKAFINILTLIAGDALDTTLLGFDADDTFLPAASNLREMVRLGQATGAIGSGAKDTGRAADLEARMEAQADEAFNDALDSFVEGGGEAALNEAVSLAALGEQQGWSLENSAGITGADVLAVTGN